MAEFSAKETKCANITEKKNHLGGGAERVGGAAVWDAVLSAGKDVSPRELHRHAPQHRSELAAPDERPHSGGLTH